METVKASVVANNRKSLSIVGQNFGCQYYRPEARQNAVNFDEKKRKIEQDGNVELTTNRATKRYLVKGYDVVSIQLGNDITGSPVVFINKDDQASEVAMPISPDLSKVGQVTEDSVSKALRGEKNIIFSDVEKLVKQCNAANQAEISRIEELKANLDKELQSLQNAIAGNIKKLDDYNHEMNASTNAASGVTVTITED